MLSPLPGAASTTPTHFAGVTFKSGHFLLEIPHGSVSLHGKGPSHMFPQFPYSPIKICTKWVVIAWISWTLISTYILFITEPPMPGHTWYITETSNKYMWYCLLKWSRLQALGMDLLKDGPKKQRKTNCPSPHWLSLGLGVRQISIQILILQLNKSVSRSSPFTSWSLRSAICKMWLSVPNLHSWCTD